MSDELQQIFWMYIHWSAMKQPIVALSVFPKNESQEEHYTY